MLTEIKNELLRLQEQHEIIILFAVESGSRAWGFASTNSDWDVRFIYVHKPEWYLSIDEKKDSMDEILPNDIDLAGWELKKALRLFRKSNPPMLEWLKSPIVYMKQFSTADTLIDLSKAYFNPKSCIYHYLQMAKGNFREYLHRDMVRVKKYFYVLRPILACDWIKQTNTMAPMEFHKLLETQVQDKRVKSAIENLLNRKIAGVELQEEPRIDILNEFLDDKISFYDHFVKSVNQNTQPDTDKLNTLFRHTLDEVWS